MAKLSPVFNDQTFDASGNPAVGYKLFTYAAGSSTKQTAYTDSAGTIAHPNPIILNASGYPTTGPIWLTTGQNYKFVLALSTDTDPPTSPVKTIDNVAGVNDSSSTNTQWVSAGATPTYVSATSFTLPGDQTSEFHAGRRLQLTTSAGTVYGTITASIYGALTTVTVLMDSGALDAGLSAVNISILRADKSAIPAPINQIISINGGQISGNRNKLINPFEVNQRALTSVADDTYCVDRWYVLTESGNVTVGQVTDPESGAPWAWKLTQPDVAAKRMGLAQIIETKDIRAYRSAAMNFFMRVKPSFSGNVRYAILEHTGTADAVTSDVVLNWSSASFTSGGFFIAGVNVIKTGTVAPGAATYGEFSDWGTFGASLNNAVLFVWTESAQAQNATLELNRPQFEPGTVHTSHEWRLNEKALCQRYCHAIKATLGNFRFGMGAASSATSVGLQINMPPNMRDSPSFTYSANADFGVTDGVTVSTTAVLTPDGTTSNSNNSVNILVTNGGWALTAFRPYHLYAINTTAQLLFTVEL